MLRTKLLSLPLIFLTCSCSNLVAEKPVGIPFDLPAHLRTCVEQAPPLTRPTILKTIGDLKLAYGDEYTAHVMLTACVSEIIRLVDIHNEQMTTGKLAPAAREK